MDDKAIQFIANLINERETKKAGYSMPVRWLCLRDDLQNKYLTEARKNVDDWWKDEEDARISREARDLFNE